MRSVRHLLLAACAAAVVAGSALAADPNPEPPAPKPEPKPPAAVDFRGEVWPIIKRKCVSCHNPTKRDGALDMSTRQTMLKGGHSGAAFVPGNVEKSLMIELIEFDEMPPRKEKKPRVTPDELKKLQAWIAAGAPAPDDQG